MEYTILNKYRFDISDDLSGVVNYEECTTANSTGVVVGYSTEFYLNYVALTGDLNDALSVSTFSVTSTGLVYNINSVSIETPIPISGSIVASNTFETANVYDIVDGKLHLNSVSNVSFYDASYWTNGSEYIHAATFSGLRNNNFVIFNNVHYRVTNDQNLIGGDPTTNVDSMDAGYTTISRNDYDAPSLNGYIEEWDFITYDFNSGVILLREDRRGNKIAYDSSFFQWGDNGITNVIQENQNVSLSIINNNGGTITGRVVGSGHNISFNNNTGSIFFDVTGKDQNIESDNNTGIIELHLIGFNVGVLSNNNSGDIRSYLYNSAYMEANNNMGIIHTRHYDSNQTVYNYNYGEIIDCIFEKPGSYGFVYITSSTTYRGCKFGHGAGTFVFSGNTSYSNKELLVNSSSFDIIIDHSGLSPSSTIDLTSTYAGIITLTYSSPTLIIDSIITDRTFPIKIKAKPGLALTISETPISSLTSDDLIVSSVSEIIVNGDTDDHITLQRTTSEVSPYVYLKQIDFKNNL